MVVSSKDLMERRKNRKPSVTLVWKRLNRSNPRVSCQRISLLCTIWKEQGFCRT